MALLQAIGRQLSFPEGPGGRVVGTMMDLANRQPVRLALDLLRTMPGERVIDVGCGTGAASQRLSRRADCLLSCVDHSPTMLHQARQRSYRGLVSFHHASLGELPFAPASFDAALALNMLYFCDEAGAMVADLKRVLRPGGRLIAYVTHRETMVKWPFVSSATHRLYDPEQLAVALTAGGFAAHSITVREYAINRHVRGLLAVAKA